MSQKQRNDLDELLRHAPLDLGGVVDEQRPIFEAMMASLPLPADVKASPIALGGVGALEITTSGASGSNTLLYFHGGAYAIGSAQASVGLASDIARRSGSRTITVEYRLAPEHPYPAAVDDAVAAYAALIETVDPATVAFVGESAGGGLVAAALLAVRDLGLPMPAAAAMFSPWADLTVSGESVSGNAAVDPSLSGEGLRLRAADYAGGAEAATPTLSPIFGDFSGLPPLLIQVGGHEVLLDDAVRLAGAAARDGVSVQLSVTADVPHVFQAFAAMLDEGDEAMDQAAAFLKRHLPNSADALAADRSAPRDAPGGLTDDDGTRDLAVADADDPTLTHLAVVGDTYTVLLSGEQTNGQYALIDMLIPAGGGPPPHRHAFEEMFHVLDGEVTVTVRGAASTATVGQTVNIPANAPHHFKNTTEAPIRLLCMVAPAGLEAYFGEFADHVASRTAPAPVLTATELGARMKIAGERAARYGIENL